MLTQATRIYEDANTASISSGVGILTDDISPADYGGGALTLQICISVATSSVLNLRVNHGAGAAVSTFNSGTALVASALYVFTVPIAKRMATVTTAIPTYNITLATSSVIRLITIDVVAGAPVGSSAQA